MRGSARRRWDVLHMVPALFDRENGVVGGAERYAFELARSMAGRVSTVLLTFGARSARWREGLLDVAMERAHHVRGQRHNPWNPAILAWVARARVVHCHQRSVLASSTAALAGRVLGRRVFTSDLGGGGWDLSGYLNTDGWYAGHLHISEYSRKVHGHEGRANAHVILGGVDHQKFSPDPTVPRERMVLYVGRILPHKGVDYLVGGVPDDVPLLVAGEPYAPAFLERLRALAHGKQVRFVHGLSDAEIVASYRKASVAVLPSVYRTSGGLETLVPELLGQTLLEAMACETPVISTRVASLPEVVSDGETGFLVPPNDSAAICNRIRWVLAHPEEARRMGAAGRRRVLERFTWDGVVERCLRLYGLTRIIHERAAGHPRVAR